MKLKNTVFSSILLAVFMLFSVQTLSAKNIKASSSRYQSDDVFMSNVQAQLQLTPEQYPKFAADHTSFNTKLAEIKKKYNNNMLLAKNDINKLISETDKSIKTYLSGTQFGMYKKLYNSGQLGKNSIPAVSANSSTTPNAATTTATKPTQNAGATTTTKTTTNAAGNNTPPRAISITNLGIQALVDPLKDAMKLTPEQYTKLMADAKEYDAKLAQIGGDATSHSDEVTTLNDQTVQKLKMYLNKDQLGKFLVATTLQQNIVMGKNLSADQKALVNKMRYTYNMNDGQIVSVALVWVEAKIKLDALQATNDPQAVQKSAEILKTVDVKIKKVLSQEQYDAIHNDIMALIQK